MEISRANYILNILLAIVFVSMILKLVLPNLDIFGLSIFSVAGGIAGITLVVHIIKNVAPANRAARDKRSNNN